MRPELDEQCVIKASAQFWEQMLAMQLTPLHHEEASLGDRHFTGRVQMSGAWNGLVEVRMSPGLASHATAAMLMQPLETVAESDTLDATREIVNMLAGVIKSSLPRPSSMTVPEAEVKPEHICHISMRADLLVVGFRHDAGDLLVRVFEQVEAPAA